MKNFLDTFIDSILKHDPNLLPMAERYYATENGVPAAPYLMETYRMVEKVNCIGTVAEDPQRHTVYAVLSVSYGYADALLGVRMTGEDEKISELEINIYHSRSDTGFWYAVQDVPGLEASWDSVVPAEKRASRETLEAFAVAIFDNSKDGNAYPAEKTCQLMEAGGLVYENVGYAQALSPVPLTNIPEGANRIPMEFGLGPIRPNGSDFRILAIDEEKGLVVAIGCMDGYVSPYIVSDETSSCFVPVPMIPMHRSTLKPEDFNGVSACKEMLATAENTTIAKFYDGKIQYLTQNIKLKTYGAPGTWNQKNFEPNSI